MSGNIIFTRQFGSASAESNAKVLVNNTGEIFISGNTTGALVGNSKGLNDIYLRTYTPTGNIVFTRQFGSTAEDSLINVHSY